MRLRLSEQRTSVSFQTQTQRFLLRDDEQKSRPCLGHRTQKTKFTREHGSTFGADDVWLLGRAAVLAYIACGAAPTAPCDLVSVWVLAHLFLELTTCDKVTQEAF